MSAYMGQKMGFVQTNYYDQMATALDGDLAYASDINLVDAAVVDMPALQQDRLLQAGRAVIARYSENAPRPGATSMAVMPPNAATTAQDIYAITIRNEQMETDAQGRNGWGNGRVCNVLRKDRVGGRVWPVAWNAAQVNTQAYIIIKDSSGHGLPIGGFCGSEIAGALLPASAGYLVSGAVTPASLKAITNGGFDITIAGTPVKVSGIDFSTANTVEDVANLLKTAITGAAVSAVGNRLIITNSTTGADSTIAYATAPTTEGATDVSILLGLTEAAGAEATQGAAASTTPDTILVPNFIWRTPAQAGQPGLIEVVPV